MLREVINHPKWGTTRNFVIKKREGNTFTRKRENRQKRDGHHEIGGSRKRAQVIRGKIIPKGTKGGGGPYWV